MKIRDDILMYAKIAQQDLGYVAGQIEVTSKCFQHCKYCSSWRDKNYNQEMSFKQMIDFVSHHLFKFPAFEHLTLTGGDPQAWRPLDCFLGWWQNERYPDDIDLQISTALARNIKNPKLWRNVIKDLRVSIDASSAEMYQKIRGDNENTANTVLARLVVLEHPTLAIITTMYPDNIKELTALLWSLDNLYQKGLKIRKVIVMAGIGVELNDEFWEEWDKTMLWALESLKVPTSFGDSIIETREICNTLGIQTVQCWASKLGFHIKPNGDVYPCCLIGGEAIKVKKEFCIGNIFELNLFDIYKRHQALSYYATQPKICRKICQFKQLQINLAGELANETKLAIP